MTTYGPDLPLVIVLTKNPVAGKVKTRLARDTSPEFALKIYTKLRAITVEALKPLDADIAVWYSDTIPDEDVFLPYASSLWLQPEGDLGLKMNTAFCQGFIEGYRRIILIGTDCPELTSASLVTAAAQLDSHKAVIGPAKDGGYYLIGLRSPQPALFESIPWSTRDVLNTTLARLDASGTNYAMLEVFSDIDTLEDLEHFNFLIP